jgi:23S rRNA pseudouridine955/2504/2580 synthase
MVGRLPRPETGGLVAKASRTSVSIDIDDRSEGMRLDRYLRKLLPAVPLSRIHTMIRKKQARLNGGPGRGNDRLRSGDRLTLSLAMEDADAIATTRHEKRRPGVKPGLPVLFHDESIVAFDKPSGMAAHPGSGHALSATVLGALYELTGSTGRGVHKPALVGRLDRDTSGVQLAGIDASALRELERMSRDGEISKAYVALVRDRGLSRVGRIQAPLFDTGGGRRRMRVLRDTAHRDAIAAATAYRIIARRDGCALVEVKPETGRQHQIRAHFSHIGAPLAGDVRYGDRAFSAAVLERAGLKRLFLHCARVEFKDPSTGNGIHVESALPEDLAHAVAVLFPDVRR